MDSELEAFSHDPTDGSFAALPFQATANANCLNLRASSHTEQNYYCNNTAPVG